MIEEEKKMSLWEHLEELRWTLFKLLLIFLAFTGYSLYHVDDAIGMLSLPLFIDTLSKHPITLTQTGPFDAVMIKMKVGILGGIALSLPLLILIIWDFIAPGLKINERKAFWWMYSSITILFTLGIIAGYAALFLVLPVLTSFGVQGAENLWRLRDYIDFVFMWLLGAGFIFELPLVIVIIVRLGLIQLKTIKKARPYSVIGAFILAAVITPSPDAVTQIVVALPMILLYELGILAASLQKPKNSDRLST
ncbi:MAG: twin arginine-targeting protein translocase TatC [Lentisphaerae bacterium GWF2_49_21]|nr:MAG: twin arginine-targeting protein translocase TatC [Lentisphaerae bacterium GWF2_49_21]